MNIIPAIDIMEGRCVRLRQGDYSCRTTYSDDPLAVARQFEEEGFTRLHMVDLDGARSACTVNLPVLEKVCSKTSLTVDFGGGLKSDADLERVFGAGAAYVCVGSVAATDPVSIERWIDRYGGERMIIGADTLGGLLRTHGWLQESEMTVFDLIERYGSKIKSFMCTDISRDGMLNGPAIELYSTIIQNYPSIELIASGGVSCAEDLRELQRCGVAGVVVGKAIYEGRLTLAELKTFERCSQNE